MKEFLSGIEEKYPKELLKNRLTVEGNVIGCIYQDSLLLDECSLTSNDFITTDGRFYFSLAKNLRKKGYVVFDEVTILSSISDEIKTSFEERGGYETIKNITEIVNIKNAETYLDNLYKEKIILRLYSEGFNLFQPINENDKNIKPIDKFAKMNSEQIVEWYESRLANLEVSYTMQVLEEEEIDFDDNFLQSLQNGEELGVPFDKAGTDISGKDMNCLPILSDQILGFMEGTLNVLGGYSSVGKTTLWITIIMGLLNYGRKVLIISNEQKSKVFKIGFLSWILYKYFKYYDLTKKKITNGQYTTEQKQMIEKARDFWRKNYKNRVKFIAIPDANLALVKKKIRQNVLEYGYDTVLYDTLKLEINDTNDKIWLDLIKDSRELDKIAKKYNIIVLASLQLAIGTLGKLFLDASVLSMSKQIKEVLETLLLMRSVYPDELQTKTKYSCDPFTLQKKDGKWVEVPYEVDPTKTYKMLFVDKARNGENSTDNGCAYLLKFNGAMGVFTEVARCRPKHCTIGTTDVKGK